MRTLLSLKICLLCSCSWLSANETLGALKASYDQIEASHLTLYEEAIADTRPGLVDRLRENQKDWTRYRATRSENAVYYERMGDVESPKEELIYWEYMNALTRERIDLLRGWSSHTEEEQWDGVWIDGYGGELKCLRLSDHFFFTLEVVRGPTFHTGFIYGVAQINSNHARYTDRNWVNAPSGNDEAWLNFSQIGPIIEIEGINTLYYHGVRAYFGGDYIYVRPLEEEEKENLRVIAKEYPGFAFFIDDAGD